MESIPPYKGNQHRPEIKSTPSLKSIDLGLKLIQNFSKILQLSSVADVSKTLRNNVKLIISGKFTWENQLNLNLMHATESVKNFQGFINNIANINALAQFPLKVIHDFDLLQYGGFAAELGDEAAFSLNDIIRSSVNILSFVSGPLKTGQKVLSFNTALQDWYQLPEKTSIEELKQKRLNLIKTSLEVTREAIKLGLGITGKTAGSYYLVIGVSGIAIVSATIGIWQIYQPKQSLSKKNNFDEEKAIIIEIKPDEDNPLQPPPIKMMTMDNPPPANGNHHPRNTPPNDKKAA